jgi:hypothetical protein
MSALPATDLPSTMITLAAWDDPLVEAHGFGPRSAYVETVYLGVLGPSSTFIYRKLGALVELGLTDVEVDLADLALSLGLGTGTGRQSPVVRSLDRLVSFGVARWLADGRYALRKALAPLPEYRLARLAPSVRRFHAQHSRHPSAS